MSVALFRKELREHGLVMLGTWALSALGFFGALRNAEAGGLSMLMTFTRIALPLCAFVAANRLVAREYAGRTLLFLEILPVSRLRVFVTKAVVGWFWVGLPALFGCVGAVSVAMNHETLDGRYVAITTSRIVVFMACFFSFSAFAATLGRFRWVVWLSVGMLAIVLENSGQTRLVDWPILALADDTLGLERRVFPVRDFELAALVGGLAFGIGVGLIVVGRGAVAMALARRMTAREKVFSVAALISILVVGEFVGNLRTRPRYALKAGVRARSELVDVAVATNENIDDSRAAELAVLLAGDAEGLMRDLKLERKLPPVFAVPQSGLDPEIYVQATLGKDDGVVVQAAFDKPGFDAHNFRAFVISRMLSQQTRGRAWLKDRAWFAWGFGLWWTAKRTHEDTARLMDRALAGSRDLPADGLDAWDRTTETLGVCLAGGVAFAAVQRLEAAIGEAGVVALARDSLAREQQPFIDIWLDTALPRRLSKAGAPSPQQLAAALALAAHEEAGRSDGLFSRLSRYEADITAVPEGGQFRLEQRFKAFPSSTQPRWRALTKSLGPWEATVNPTDARRFDLDATAPAVLPVSLARGELLFAALETFEPTLGCTVRPWVRRWELK